MKTKQELMNEWKGEHCFPEEGWAIFFNDTIEVEKIDELGLLKNDIEARELAIKKGYRFNNPDNIFEVTAFPENSLT